MICKYCEVEFDHKSRAKIVAGGRINECPDCVDELGTETTVRYLGVRAGNGKMSDVTILAFDSEHDKQVYHKAWRNNSGQNVGKSCQLGTHLRGTAGGNFRIVTVNTANENHKGKL